MKTLHTHNEEMEKVVLYVNSECDYNNLSHEDRLKLKAKEVTIWLGETTKGVWGDDWNDAPDEHNSGTPYENTVKGLEKITIKLGEPLPFSKQLYIKIAEGELKRLEESLKRKEYKIATHYSPDNIETITIPDSYESAFHLGETINTKNSIQYWNNILQELNK